MTADRKEILEDCVVYIDGSAQAVRLAAHCEDLLADLDRAETVIATLGEALRRIEAGAISNPSHEVRNLARDALAACELT